MRCPAENVDAVASESSNELGDEFNLGMAGRSVRPRGVCLPRYFWTERVVWQDIRIRSICVLNSYYYAMFDMVNVDD